jgi:hypothetical protein
VYEEENQNYPHYSLPSKDPKWILTAIRYILTGSEAKGLQLTAVAIDNVDDRAQRGSGLESQVAAALRGAMCPLTDYQATLPLRVCCGANEG